MGDVIIGFGEGFFIMKSLLVGQERGNGSPKREARACFSACFLFLLYADLGGRRNSSLFVLGEMGTEMGLRRILFLVCFPPCLELEWPPPKTI